MSIELKQAAQQALEVLENAPGGCGFMWQIKANEAIASLRAAIQQAEAAASGPVARVDYSERGNIAWLFGQQLPDGTELFKHPAPGVPEFSRIAKRKLDEPQEQGFAITGYAIQRGTERGFITDGGFVGWWRSDEAPGVPDGWQLVPIEPTAAMLQAALKVATPGALRAAWARMLAASPAQKGGE